VGNRQRTVDNRQQTVDSRQHIEAADDSRQQIPEESRQQDMEGSTARKEHTADSGKRSEMRLKLFARSSIFGKKCYMTCFISFDVLQHTQHSATHE
jgi:hypothetical protein